MLTEQTNKVQAIYFAAPPTEIKFIMEVRKYLRKKQIHVYTALEMIDYIEDNYSHCQTGTIVALVSVIIYQIKRSDGKQVRSAEFN